MCLVNQNDSTKSRRMTALGCALLVIALSERALLSEASSPTAHHWVNGASILLLCLSVAFNLYALRLRKRGNH